MNISDSQYYYIEIFCNKCKKEHYLAFTKENINPIEIMCHPEELNIIGTQFILCAIGMKVLDFTIMNKYRLKCDEAFYLMFEDGIYMGIKG